MKRQEERFAEAYRILREAIAAHAFPCCAFGVLRHGETLVADALGQFVYNRQSARAEAETVFDVASLTKTVATTAAAMLLHQRGQLNLDLPVGALLPGFVAGRAADDAARHIKLRHLLAHNSGLPGYVEFFRCTNDINGLRAILADLPLEAEPGERAVYSDPGFILLGQALEVITGDSLASWCRREIYLPLRMNATRYRPPASQREAIPPTETEAVTGRLIQGEVQDENARILSGVAGHAGLFSNVPDLLRFAGAILSGHRSECETELFTRETIALFATRQMPAGSSRALGWDTPSENSSSGRYFSRQTIGHLGFSGCSLWIDLEADLAIVLLTNRTWPDRQNQAIRRIRPAFHDAIREAMDKPTSLS